MLGSLNVKGSAAAVSDLLKTCPSPFHLLERAATARPNHVAIEAFLNVTEPYPTAITYKNLIEHVIVISKALRASGVGPDDGVALIMPPCCDLVASYLAAVTVAVAVPVNLLLSEDAMAAIFRAANVKAVLCMPSGTSIDAVGRARAAAQKCDVLVLVAGTIDEVTDDRSLAWPQFLSRAHSKSAEFKPNSGNQIAAVFQTGGTTGTPKLAQLSGRNLAAGGIMIAASTGLLEEDRLVQPMPLFHVAGAIASTFGPIAVGATIILPSVLGARDPSFVSEIWNFVSRTKASLLGLIPTSLSAIVASPLKDSNISCLRAICTGGAALLPTLDQAVRQTIGCPIYQVYGMTEASGVVAGQHSDGRFQTTAVGPVAFGVEVQLLDSNRREAHQGEVHIRGPNVFQGYRGLTPHKSELWLSTGDLGEWTEDGQLRLIGRSKDVIIRSGHNIDPQLIEEIAHLHPAVLLAGAVGMPDAYAGEIPVLFVTLAPGANVSADELRRFVRKHSPEPPARPKNVFVLKEMPLTPFGKVARYRLKQLAVEIRVREIAGTSCLVCCSDQSARTVSLKWRQTPTLEALTLIQAAIDAIGIVIEDDEKVDAEVAELPA